MGSREPDQDHAVGSPNVDDQRYGNEGPVHEVTLHPFLLAKHEVTLGQWTRLFADKLSQHQPGTWNGVTLRMPVTDVDWDQCREACRRWGLVLPTESRWEYACRAGTGTRYFTGDASASLKGFANVISTEPGSNPAMGMAIGGLKPNAFGLHDVHGNVFEWCLDGFDFYGRRKARAGDGLRTPWQSARARVLRGGGFSVGARDVRSAFRHGFPSGFRNDDLGFRPALNVTTF